MSPLIGPHPPPNQPRRPVCRRGPYFSFQLSPSVNAPASVVSGTVLPSQPPPPFGGTWRAISFTKEYFSGRDLAPAEGLPLYIGPPPRRAVKRSPCRFLSFFFDQPSSVRGFLSARRGASSSDSPAPSFFSPPESLSSGIVPLELRYFSDVLEGGDSF